MYKRLNNAFGRQTEEKQFICLTHYFRTLTLALISHLPQKRNDSSIIRKRLLHLLKLYFGILNKAFPFCIQNFSSN